MRAEQVMRRDLVLCRPTETVGEALVRMRGHGLRMLPVVDDDGRLLGALWTCGLLARVVPEYIAEGEMGAVHYAPDIGLLRRRYQEIAGATVEEVMDRDPVTVAPDESLLAVAASILARGVHPEYTLVVDADRRLLGLISAGDVLDALLDADAEGDGA